ncbi:MULTISPECIES: hypothetical protein [unclassified Pseudomonas]|uniref:hypothetical protein n=1 Tax=unclassified Pseudomonas TaxID=196821 RepID=UPI0012EDBCF1|nr:MULTISPECIES: hypothetical protein [unclassified Pseudomonas]
MKVTTIVIILVALAGCVSDEFIAKAKMIPKRDPQLAYRCEIDPYKPECSVN